MSGTVELVKSPPTEITEMSGISALRWSCGCRPTILTEAAERLALSAMSAGPPIASAKKAVSEAGGSTSVPSGKHPLSHGSRQTTAAPPDPASRALQSCGDIPMRGPAHRTVATVAWDGAVQPAPRTFPLRWQASCLRVRHEVQYVQVSRRPFCPTFCPSHS